MGRRYLHILREEIRRPLRLVTAIVLGAALGWLLPTLIAAVPPTREARILLGACALGIGVLPALITLGAVRHVRMEWRALPLSVASLLVLALLFLPTTPLNRLRVSRVIVGVGATLVLLLASGAPRNIRAACQLAPGQRVAIQPTAGRSGILFVSGTPYHVSFAQPICRER